MSGKSGRFERITDYILRPNRGSPDRWFVFEVGAFVLPFSTLPKRHTTPRDPPAEISPKKKKKPSQRKVNEWFDLRVLLAFFL